MSDTEHVAADVRASSLAALESSVQCTSVRDRNWPNGNEMTDGHGSDPASGHTRRGRHRRARAPASIGLLSWRKGLLVALPVLAVLGFVLVLNAVIGAPPANDTTFPAPRPSEQAHRPDSGQADERFTSPTDPVNTVSPTPPPATSAPLTDADPPPSTPLPQTKASHTPSGPKSGRGNKPATPPGRIRTSTPPPSVD